MATKLQPGFMTNLDDFLSSVDKEETFKPFGELISTYTINSGTHCSIDDIIPNNVLHY